MSERPTAFVFSVGEGRESMSLPGSIDEFLERVREELDLEKVMLTPDSSLGGDLQLDSFDLFRLAILLETMRPGFDIPEQADLAEVTLADIFYYISLPSS